jgi:hypothetical protein
MSSEKFETLAATNLQVSKERENPGKAWVKKKSASFGA